MDWPLIMAPLGGREVRHVRPLFIALLALAALSWQGHEEGHHEKKTSVPDRRGAGDRGRRVRGGEPVGGSIRAPLPDMPRFVGSHAPTPPSVINFQGVLTNPTTGNLVADGNYSIAFRVFDVSADGTSLWTETQGSVAVSGGRFSVLLGSTAPFPANLFAGTPRYLEVQVGADPPLTPRQQWSAVPYAFHATTADSADDAETLQSGAAGSAAAWSATRTGYVPNTAGTMTTIPGLSVTISLSQPALVQMVSTGTERATSTFDYCRVGLGFRIDGSLRGSITYGQRFHKMNSTIVNGGIQDWGL